MFYKYIIIEQIALITGLSSVNSAEITNYLQTSIFTVQLELAPIRFFRI